MSSKAIVVFYMHGGHDGYNMLVPLDRYDRYAHYRGTIAQSRDSLLPLNVGQGDLAIHGNFPRMAALIQEGKGAPILGTGNLAQPVNRQQYDDRSVVLPPFLFSHSHQQQYNKGAYDRYSGWAGRVLDAWYASNGSAPALSPAVTTTGDRNLVAAESLDVLQVQSEGETWQGLSAAKLDAVNRLVADDSYNHPLERVARHALGTTITGQAYLRDIFGQFTESGKLNTAAMVASKLIAAADELGHQRQIIHIAAPGPWDSHFDQFDTLNEAYAYLDNLFVDFIDELRRYGVADRVVCITASDFGRSLVPNNRGTDHGWGNNHLVWGEPVRGGQAIGNFVDYDDPDQWTGARRLIPTLADVQSYATLARWFGLDEDAIDAVFPTLRNFSQRDLGFLP